MARYTSSFLIAVKTEYLHSLIIQLLQDCGFSVQFYSHDYIMASEIPGKVAFSKLVSIEVLVDKSKAENETWINLVVKSEELPLKLDNHCRQVFDQVRQEVEHNRKWQLIESVVNC
ncbi:hypothetical protein GSN00_12515 [Cylindrospermopsis raciborskii CHAB3438]|uniref:hypothetical protein n=1 Tax=Cylindrospermopsis TaxID=77021 RepID=UPI000710214F|nr:MULTISPECIES: hypothetical protein [Cylindrospermopsis]KRH96090.1 hypothetical protein ASL19_02330 [Cylindrospermopsis sp. CR12]MBU6343820.1 hypothetical protein [Cyanobacteria bacterium REEB494]MCH4905177.1 hypothetical protein [Cylindrospermopsis raciborskii CHAB3438]MEB3145286.1 hypothetical protein [Cylindrospermopsis raciborskii]